MQHTHTLGEGCTITLEIIPSFPFPTGVVTKVIPDPLFPQIKGSLTIQTGPNVPVDQLLAHMLKVGEAAMGATAKLVITGPAPQYQVGFKQVASFKFTTDFYVGLKESDGSIEEGSRQLNFTDFLDASIVVGATSSAPFYLAPSVVGNGREASLDMVDQPGGRRRLQRRNNQRDRVNYLVTSRSESDFLTFLVVVLPSGKHVPVEGLFWSATQNVDVGWKAGQPSVVRQNVGVQLKARGVELKASDPRFAILANPSLTNADTLPERYNKAMFAAQNGHATADYAIEEFPTYGPNVSEEMKDRSFQSFPLN
jgi:hypothetical protein